MQANEEQDAQTKNQNKISGTKGADGPFRVLIKRGDPNDSEYQAEKLLDSIDDFFEKI